MYPYVNYWPYYSYSPYYKYSNGYAKPAEDTYFRSPHLRRNHLPDYNSPSVWRYEKMGASNARTSAGVRQATTRMMLSGKFSLAYCKPSA